MLVVGAKAPKLVSNELVARMRQGSVLVDISVDQGGCFEATQPTTHSNPTFEVNGSIFYCVANMPGRVPATSTDALSNATLPYAVELAHHGWREAVVADDSLAEGVNVVKARSRTVRWLTHSASPIAHFGHCSRVGAVATAAVTTRAPGQVGRDGEDRKTRRGIGVARLARRHGRLVGGDDRAVVGASGIAP